MRSQNGASLGIVTRLDRETSGVVLVAKHTAGRPRTRMDFRAAARRRRNTWRSSRAGRKLDAWECAEPIIRAGELGPSAIWVRQIVSPLGRDCLTRFRVERTFRAGEGGSFPWSVVFPKPGGCTRSACIWRVADFPIVGDKIYSGDGSEYLEWMDNRLDAGIAATLDSAPPRAPCRRLARSIGTGIRSAGKRTWPGIWWSFPRAGKSASTPDVVIWSRHD